MCCRLRPEPSLACGTCRYNMYTSGKGWLSCVYCSSKLNFHSTTLVRNGTILIRQKTFALSSELHTMLQAMESVGLWCLGFCGTGLMKCVQCEEQKHTQLQKGKTQNKSICNCTKCICSAQKSREQKSWCSCWEQC